MVNLIKHYVFKAVEYSISKIWDGVWTAIGFILIMKATGVFIVLTS